MGKIIQLHPNNEEDESKHLQKVFARLHGHVSPEERAQLEDEDREIDEDKLRATLEEFFRQAQAMEEEKNRNKDK